MDPSILKLLKENEDESMHSRDDVDAFEASLSREIEGKNPSSGQHLATCINGTGDANTNLHILERTLMKEQQRSVSGNQSLESKRENKSHIQHNPPQDHREPGQLGDNPSHVPQASNLQSRDNPISNEPERPQSQYLKLQKMSNQRTHAVKQPVDPVNHGHKEVQVLEFLRIFIARVDKDRKAQLLTLFNKFKRKEIAVEGFLRQISNVVGDQMTRFAISKLPQLQQVNFPAPSGTIPAGANVRTTPEMPSVGQKKPLEALGSSLPPPCKKQKLSGTSLDGRIKHINDVTALSGIILREEKKRLLLSGPKNDGHVTEGSRRVVHEEEERTILQKVPLERKLAEIMSKSGLKHINDDVERCLSLCVEERMRGLLSNIIRVSKERIDAEKCRNRTCITSDIRKQINEMNQKLKEEWERKHGGEKKLKNEENDTAKEDNRSERVKANKKEQDEKTAEAANVAAFASIGGENAFLKWKLMAKARQKPSSGPGRNSKKPPAETGGRRFGQGSPKVSVKDVIAVVEKEPQMSRSTLSYRLYNRICSDVRTQEKT